MKRTRSLGFAGILFGVVVLVGPPLAAREEEGPRGSLATPQTEGDLGRRAAAQAAAQLGLVEDPEVVAYVRAIGKRLARHAPGYRYGYEFQIVDQGAPNAFAIPGGFIFVSRGLLVLSNSEAELANVIGHEIAHAALRHSAAQQRIGGTGFLRALQQPFLAAYGRDLERSADRVGQGLAALAGYDPTGMGEFLGGLDQLERFRRGRSRIPSFRDTHPTSGSRSNEAHARAGLISWKPKPEIVEGRAGYYEQIDGLVIGDPAEQGVFDGPRFLHADLAFTIRFPDDWRTQNSPRAVGAFSPRRDAWVSLEMAAGQGHPRDVAEAWIEQQEDEIRNVRLEPVRLLGRDAVRVVGRAGGLSFMATFVDWRGTVYRITGASGNMRRHEPLLLQVARSFRPMTRELLAKVTERKLRVVEARTGETFAALVERTGTVWAPAEAAVYNARKLDYVLSAGEPVKIAVEVPYVPKPAAAR